MSRSLRHNFFWALASNLLGGAIGWGTYIVLAKVGTPELVGQYALGLAVVTPLGFFTDLHLRATLATDTQRQFDFSDYLGLRLAAGAGLFLAVALVVLVAGYSREASLVILATCVGRVVESVIDLFYGLFQQQERMDRVARSLLLRGPVSLALLAGVVALTQSAFWGVVALGLVRLGSLLGHDVPAGIRTLREGDALAGQNALLRVRPRWEPSILRRLAWLTLPLGLVMMLIALNTSIPQYFVQHHGGERELGYFGALVSLAGAGAFLAAAAGQAISPRLARALAAGDLRGFRRLLWILILFGFVLGGTGVAAVLLFGRPLLALVYRPEYAEFDTVLAWLILALTLDQVASFLGWGIMATRRFHHYPVPYLITTVLVSAASAVLIPWFGLTGAAWAMGIANGASFLVLLGILMASVRRAPSA